MINKKNYDHKQNDQSVCMYYNEALRKMKKIKGARKNDLKF